MALGARAGARLARLLRAPARRFAASKHPIQEAKDPSKRRILELALVRHGQSEGNVAYSKSVHGDSSMYSGKFLDRHSSLWRLTDRGRGEAVEAGAWLRDRCAPFDAFYTSEFLRAMETAALLDMDGAQWHTETNCRERDWGALDLLPKGGEDPEEDQRRRRHGLYFAPSGGESLASVIIRVDLILAYLNGRYPGRRVLMVCHGELMWAFRLRFERLSQLRYREMQAENCAQQKIQNGQIIVYSRRCPETGTLHKHFRFMRFVCPWDISRSGGDGWFPIERSGGLTGAELLRQARSFPRIYNNRSCSMTDPELKRRVTRYRASASSAIDRAP